MGRTETTALKGLLFLFVTGLICTGLLSCRDSGTAASVPANDDKPENSAAGTGTWSTDPASLVLPPELADLEFKVRPLSENAVELASTSGYISQALGTLGEHTFGLDINESGQIAGWSYIIFSTERRAFFWENGTITVIGTFGGNTSWAWGINDMGQVAGESSIAPGGSNHAFIWDAMDGMTDIHVPALFSSRAWDINNGIQVAGHSLKFSGSILERHAFLWENGTFTDLGTLGGNSSDAYGINASGQVVGRSQISNGAQHAFLWESGSGMTDLGTLGGDYSHAYAINDHGQVVGFSETSSGKRHAFLWENGTMTDLGTLGGTWSEAFDINNAGDIVGRSRNSSGFLIAVIWRNGFMIELDGNDARGINESGQITGYRINTSTGQAEALIWNPADQTPPEISFTLETESLWPPNHKMVLAVSGISAVDDVDGPVTPSVDVSSNEAVNGKGDGNTSPDWEIVDNGDGTFDVYLRAERSGRGNGRIYTVAITAEDAAANPAGESVEVTVAHDKGK